MSDQKNPKNKWESFAEEQEQDEEVLEQPIETDVDPIEQNRLEDQLTAVKQQLKDSQETQLRMAAELQNVRDRSAKEITKAHKFANEKLVNELLPIVDSLTRGLEVRENLDQVNPQSLIDGMQLTLDMLQKVLNQHGVEVIAPKAGEAFNPELHEAMSMQKVPDTKANTVLQVLQKGFSLHGRVVRAAMVIVAG